MTERLPWEDHLLERKTERDLKVLRRTAVGFANSVKPGHVATILVGECNDGSVPGVTNADQIQRSIRSELDKIYPPIEWRQIVYEKDGQSCIRIDIEYDGETPHFEGAAWIRQGSETLKASDEMLQKLVELRSSKVRELNRWLNKEVTVAWSLASAPVGMVNWSSTAHHIVKITHFFVTFQKSDSKREKSEPIQWLDISWDDEHNRLMIYVNPLMSPLR